jgi:4-amino-4-deoxy-L-arabinose transferase-like glycosyltransferase
MLMVLLYHKTWRALAHSPLHRLLPRLVARQDRIADALTCGVSLLLYVLTAAPDLLPADSGEFQIVAPLLGVAHPPGYPLYTLLGRLCVLLIPFGPAAYRLNLLSAFLAAGTLTLTGAATRRWARRLGAAGGGATVGGVLAALTLGTATTFWAQSGVANVRMPTMFLAALALYALARYADALARQKAASDLLSQQTQGRPPVTQDMGQVGKLDPPGNVQDSRQGQADRALLLLALALSLGLSHHPSLLFLGIFFVLYLFLVDPRLLLQPRRWWRPLLVALLALSPLLYLPLRGAGDAPLAPSNLDTLQGLWQHVSAQGFGDDMFAYANLQDLPSRLALLPTLFSFQFNLLLLLAAALALPLLAWRDRRLLALLAGGLVLHTFVSITYRAPQTVEYLMPAYLPLAILAGLLTAYLISSSLAYRFSPLPTFLVAFVLLGGLSNGFEHAPSFFTLSDDRSTRAAAESILEQAPQDALVLADWHWATPLWYVQWVEGQRPDVEVHYVYPVPNQEYSDTWRERIEAADDQRPLLLTHAYELADYTLEPVGAGFWLHPRPYSDTLTALSPLEAAFYDSASQSGLRLLGYRVNRLQPRPGQTLELTLAWQAGELAAPPSFSAQLVDSEGRRLAQADSFLGTGYAPGEVRFAQLALPLYPGLPPGNYQLVLETYSAGEEGFQSWSLPDGATRLELATLPLRPSSTRPSSLHPLSIPFADGPTLTGVDYDRTLPGTLRLYLHWRGPAHGGEEIQVRGVTTRLPPLSAGVYQTVALDLPGETRGRLALTLSDVDGQLKLVAGHWGWPLRQAQLPAPSSTARFVPLGEDMALVGVSPGPGSTVSPGDTLTLRLDFLALKPLVNDYGVSVRLLDGDGNLKAMHDLQPALGAIPTLKWIRGSRITDPHPLQIPEDLDTDTVRAELVVYERFRGVSLKPLDGRLGMTVPLGEWEMGGSEPNSRISRWIRNKPRPTVSILPRSRKKSAMTRLRGAERPPFCSNSSKLRPLINPPGLNTFRRSSNMRSVMRSGEL